MEKLAEAIGRTRRKGGQHPTYVLPPRPALSIPHHSKPMKRRTKDSILSTLEGDLAIEEERLLNEADRQNGHLAKK